MNLKTLWLHCSPKTWPPSTQFLLVTKRHWAEECPNKALFMQTVNSHPVKPRAPGLDTARLCLNLIKRNSTSHTSTHDHWANWASHSRPGAPTLPLSGKWMPWYCEGVRALSGSPKIFIKSTLKMSSSRSIWGGAGGRGGAAVGGKGTHAKDPTVMRAYSDPSYTLSLG